MLLALVATGPLRGADRATVLFFNDAHQLSPVIDRFGERGGVARLGALVASVRAEQPSTVLIFGGDLAGGTLFGGQFRGGPQVEAFNRIGLDLASFGQHDFDFGSTRTRELIAASRFPWITTNLRAADGAPFAGLERSRVLRVGGLRIAFLGLTDAMDTTTAEDVVEADLVTAAKDEIERLDALTPPPDAILALAQTDDSTAERLLREVPRIAAVLAEERAEDRTVVQWIGSRPVAAPAGNMGSLVRLDLERMARGRIDLRVQALPVDGAAGSDTALAALETQYESLLDQALSEPVASLGTALSASGARSGESLLGSLVADAFRASCGAEVGLMQSGGLRADLPAGRLRRRELVGVLPFGNRVVCASVTGANLRAALEHGAAGVERQLGTLLQVSGLSYRIARIDESRAAGQRVENIRVDGQPLDAIRSYRVALSSYLAAGRDGFEMLSGALATATTWAAKPPTAALLDGLANASACGDPAVAGDACAPTSAPALDVDALAKYLKATAHDGVVAPPEAGRLDFDPGATIPAQP